MLNNYRKEFDVEKNPPLQLSGQMQQTVQEQPISIEDAEPVLSIVAICSLEDKETRLSEWLKHLPKLPAMEVVVVFTVPQHEGKALGIEHLQDRGPLRFFNYTYESFSFSEARNAAIRQAQGEWILSLDMDEVVPQHQHASLMEMAEYAPDDYDCFFCHVASVIANPIAGHYTNKISRVPRLFRNRENIYFQGHCHEFVSWVVPKERQGECSLMICHAGYMADVDTLLVKYDRNIHLLARDLYETGPGDKRIQFIKTYLRNTLNQEQQLLEYRNQHHNATN